MRGDDLPHPLRIPFGRKLRTRIPARVYALLLTGLLALLVLHSLQGAPFSAAPHEERWWRCATLSEGAPDAGRAHPLSAYRALYRRLCAGFT